MVDRVQRLQDIIGYSFEDPSIAFEAVSAAGAAITSVGARRFPNGNKRLAVLGDTVLQLALAEGWYDGDEARVGFNRVRQRISSNQNLCTQGTANNIGTLIHLSGGQTAVAPVTMADTMEAILGAVYIDSKSMGTVKAVMQALGLTP
ncbi:MAG: hypothetical protein Q9212_004445 [Teloschistes hypoglaucus]